METFETYKTWSDDQIVQYLKEYWGCDEFVFDCVIDDNPVKTKTFWKYKGSITNITNDGKVLTHPLYNTPLYINIPNFSDFQITKGSYKLEFELADRKLREDFRNMFFIMPVSDSLFQLNKVKRLYTKKQKSEGSHGETKVRRINKNYYGKNVYLFDTNAFIDYPNILESLLPDAIAILSDDVSGELNSLKDRAPDQLTKAKCNKAIKQIIQYTTQYKNWAKEKAREPYYPFENQFKNRTITSDSIIISTLFKRSFIGSHRFIVTSDNGMVLLGQGHEVTFLTPAAFFEKMSAHNQNQEQKEKTEEKQNPQIDVDKILENDSPKKTNLFDKIKKPAKIVGKVAVAVALFGVSVALEVLTSSKD